MKYKILLIMLSVMLLCGLIANAAAFAGAQEIKNRMKARLSAIADLKKQGVIGEDNRGYLQFVGNTKTQQDVIDAENADRKLVYEAIAKNQGSTADVVGKRRALKIAQKAAPGEWLQDTNGKWYEK